jgi:D-arabinose 1-dehydrogenase-like Zn-dependent alcohol dehydrogenase
MCAGLTVFSGMRHAGFRPGSRVAVIGLGGLGHVAVLFAKAMGGRVAVLSSSAGKEPEARELGAERFIDVGSAKPGEALKAWAGGADLIIATAPDARTMATSFPGLAIDGTMLVLWRADGDGQGSHQRPGGPGDVLIQGQPSANITSRSMQRAFAVSFQVPPTTLTR